MDLSEKQPSVYEGNAKGGKKANVVVTVSDADFAQIARGKLSGATVNHCFPIRA